MNPPTEATLVAEFIAGLASIGVVVAAVALVKALEVAVREFPRVRRGRVGAGTHPPASHKGLAPTRAIPGLGPP